MLRLVTDEDVHDDIIRGMRRRVPGVLALVENIGTGRVIDDILLIALCHATEEIKDQVLFIPL
jgi:hypothetical protein